MAGTLMNTHRQKQLSVHVTEHRLTKQRCKGCHIDDVPGWKKSCVHFPEHRLQVGNVRAAEMIMYKIEQSYVHVYGALIGRAADLIARVQIRVRAHKGVESADTNPAGTQCGVCVHVKSTYISTCQQNA